VQKPKATITVKTRKFVIQPASRRRRGDDALGWWCPLEVGSDVSNFFAKMGDGRVRQKNLTVFKMK
jgi:hypothetical protein